MGEGNRGHGGLAASALGRQPPGLRRQAPFRGVGAAVAVVMAAGTSGAASAKEAFNRGGPEGADDPASKEACLTADSAAARVPAERTASGHDCRALGGRARPRLQGRRKQGSRQVNRGHPALAAGAARESNSSIVRDGARGRRGARRQEHGRARGQESHGCILHRFPSQKNRTRVVTATDRPSEYIPRARPGKGAACSGR